MNEIFCVKDREESVETLRLVLRVRNNRFTKMIILGGYEKLKGKKINKARGGLVQCEASDSGEKEMEEGLKERIKT